MIDKKKLIKELLECIADATDTETQITSLTMAGILMNEVLDEALPIGDVVKPKGTFYCVEKEVNGDKHECEQQCSECAYYE